MQAQGSAGRGISTSMKKLLPMLIAVFVAGLAVSLAWAAPPPDKGKPDKPGRPGKTTSSTTSTSTSSSGATTSEGKKALVCHRTGSKKKPYHLISVSRSSLPSHVAHGDVMPSGGECPKTVPTTTSSSP
jgi:hypothetical protein